MGNIGRRIGKSQNTAKGADGADGADGAAGADHGAPDFR